MAFTMAYATVEEVLREMDAMDVGVDEELLAEKIDEAQRVIEGITDRVFEAAADTTRYVDYERRGVDGRTLFLPWDICQIASITNGDGTAVTVNDYVTVPRLRDVSGGRSHVPNNPQGWPFYAIELKQGADVTWTYQTTPEEAIAIEGRWAFSVTPPADIKRACIRLAHWLYLQKDDLRDRPAPQTSQEGILLLMNELPGDVQSRLLRYVRH